MSSVLPSRTFSRSGTLIGAVLSVTLIAASLWAGATLSRRREEIAQHVERVGELLAAQQALAELARPEPPASETISRATEQLERVLAERPGSLPAPSVRRELRSHLLAELRARPDSARLVDLHADLDAVHLDLGSEVAELRRSSAAGAVALWSSWSAIQAILVVGGVAALLCTVLLELGRRRAEAQRRTLAALEDSERRLASIFARLPIALFETDERGVLVFLRGSSLEGLGLRRENLLGRTLLELHRSNAEFPASLQRALEGESLTTRIELDGLHLLCVLGPIRDGDGRIVGVSGVATDVTDEVKVTRALRSSEEARQHTQKLEAVGRISSVVAHEFANLLTIIRGMTELLQIELGPHHASQKELAGIQQASQRATRLSQELLDFARPQPDEPRVLDLSGLVARVRPWLAAMLRPSTHIELELDERALPVKLDPGRMEQVLLNLARNAEDAMPAGGTLTLRTALLADGGRPAARLTVRDTGHGMSSEVRAKIFEPFFTTKEHGTGLGLSVTHGLVAQAGGTITVTSEPGQGTTFELLFPLQAESELELRPQEPPASRHQDSAMLDLLQRR